MKPMKMRAWSRYLALVVLFAFAVAMGGCGGGTTPPDDGKGRILVKVNVPSMAAFPANITPMRAVVHLSNGYDSISEWVMLDNRTGGQVAIGFDEIPADDYTLLAEVEARDTTGATWTHSVGKPFVGNGQARVTGSGTVNVTVTPTVREEDTHFTLKLMPPSFGTTWCMWTITATPPSGPTLIRKDYGYSEMDPVTNRFFSTFDFSNHRDGLKPMTDYSIGVMAKDSSDDTKVLLHMEPFTVKVVPGAPNHLIVREDGFIGGSADVSTGVLTPPSRPTGLKAGRNEWGNPTVSWNASERCEGDTGYVRYNVYRAPAENPDDRRYLGNTDWTQYTDMGTEAGKSYLYWVMPKSGMTGLTGEMAGPVAFDA